MTLIITPWLVGWTLVWLLALVVSTWVVFEVVGIRLMVTYFPEGRRWWQLPAQFVALGLFAAVIHFHPF